jgi:hypothetical protein
MSDISTDSARDELDAIWHQLGSLEEPGPSVVLALRRVVLVTRGLLRRVDEVEANLLKQEKET